MRNKFPFDLSGSRPTIAGTGLIALDIVIPTEPNSIPQLWAGGTCGNVLAALSFLGWESIPIARLGNESASKQIMRDFERWGVRLDFLGLEAHGSTPVIVQHIHCSPDRGTTHSFSRKCPQCGKRLPWYKPVRVADVTSIVERLPAVDVFFFDRTSAGAIHLARYAKERGALVVFEPSASSDDKELARAMKLAHIVKYSQDRFSDLDKMAGSEEVPLLIETHGSAGLRFLSRLPGGNRVWEISKAVTVPKVIDTAGCGDWCTAGVIAMLGASGRIGFEEAAPSQVRQAVQFGQALAAWNCSFEGARGGMYEPGEAYLKKPLAHLMADIGIQFPAPRSMFCNYGQPTEYSCVSCGEPLAATN